METTTDGGASQNDNGCCDGCATDTAAGAATAAASSADRPLLVITPRSRTETGAPAEAAKDPGAVTGCCDSCSTTQPARLKQGTLLNAVAVPVQIRPQKTLPLVDNPRHDDGDGCCEGH